MNIKEFCTETKLKLREVEDNPGLYAECSGKTYARIKYLVSEYCKRHNTRIYCWDDKIKDVTYIDFRR